MCQNAWHGPVLAQGRIHWGAPILSAIVSSRRGLRRHGLGSVLAAASGGMVGSVYRGVAGVAGIVAKALAAGGKLDASVCRRGLRSRLAPLPVVSFCPG